MSDQPLNIDDVSKVLRLWDIMFPSKERTENMLKAIIATYFTSLAPRFSRKAFFLAAERAQCNSRFFPSISDIIWHRDDVLNELGRQREQRARQLLLEDPNADRSPEEEERGLACMALIKEMFSDKADRAAIVRQVEQICGVHHEI